MSKKFQDGNLSLVFPDFKQVFKPLEDVGHVEVGILGSKKAKDDEITVAGYGRLHEFGDPSQKIPMRSWLREPLRVRFPKYLEEHLAHILKYIMEGRKEEALENLGQEARNICIEAFKTHGVNGEWAPNSKETIARKGVNNPLIDSGELRRSVDYKVVLTNKG